MDKSLIPMTTFNLKELFLMSCAMSHASRTIQGLPPKPEMSNIMLQNQKEFRSLMLKVGLLMEAAIT